MGGEPRAIVCGKWGSKHTCQSHLPFTVRFQGFSSERRAGWQAHYPLGLRFLLVFDSEHHVAQAGPQTRCGQLEPLILLPPLPRFGACATLMGLL